MRHGASRRERGSTEHRRPPGEDPSHEQDPSGGQVGFSNRRPDAGHQASAGGPMPSWYSPERRIGASVRSAVLADATVFDRLHGSRQGGTGGGERRTSEGSLSPTPSDTSGWNTARRLSGQGSGQISNLEATAVLLQSSLKGHGFRVNLLSTAPEDLANTLNCIRSIVDKVQKETERADEATQEARRLRNELVMAEHAHTRLKKELELQKRDVGGLMIKNSQTEASHREEQQRLNRERAELQRKCANATRVSVHFQHGIRKKELEYEKLQDKLRYYLAEKKREAKASFEIVGRLKKQSLQHTGRTKSSSKPDDDMYKIVRAYEDKQKEMLMENKDLKASLRSLQREYTELLNSKGGQVHVPAVSGGRVDDPACDPSPHAREGDVEETGSAGPSNPPHTGDAGHSESTPELRLGESFVPCIGIDPVDCEPSYNTLTCTYSYKGRRSPSPQPPGRWDSGRGHSPESLMGAGRQHRLSRGGWRQSPDASVSGRMADMGRCLTPDILMGGGQPRWHGMPPRSLTPDTSVSRQWGVAESGPSHEEYRRSSYPPLSNPSVDIIPSFGVIPVAGSSSFTVLPAHRPPSLGNDDDFELFSNEAAASSAPEPEPHQSCHDLDPVVETAPEPLAVPRPAQAEAGISAKRVQVQEFGAQTAASEFYVSVAVQACCAVAEASVQVYLVEEAPTKVLSEDAEVQVTLPEGEHPEATAAARGPLVADVGVQGTPDDEIKEGVPESPEFDERVADVGTQTTVVEEPAVPAVMVEEAGVQTTETGPQIPAKEVETSEQHATNAGARPPAEKSEEKPKPAPLVEEDPVEDVGVQVNLIEERQVLVPVPEPVCVEKSTADTGVQAVLLEEQENVVCEEAGVQVCLVPPAPVCMEAGVQASLLEDMQVPGSAGAGDPSSSPKGAEGATGDLVRETEEEADAAGQPSADAAAASRDKQDGTEATASLSSPAAEKGRGRTQWPTVSPKALVEKASQLKPTPKGPRGAGLGKLPVAQTNKPVPNIAALDDEQLKAELRLRAAEVNNGTVALRVATKAMRPEDFRSVFEKRLYMELIMAGNLAEQQEAVVNLALSGLEKVWRNGESSNEHGTDSLSEADSDLFAVERLEALGELVSEIAEGRGGEQGAEKKLGKADEEGEEGGMVSKVEQMKLEIERMKRKCMEARESQAAREMSKELHKNMPTMREVTNALTKEADMLEQAKSELGTDKEDFMATVGKVRWRKAQRSASQGKLNPPPPQVGGPEDKRPMSP